jgi:hypothetical protein
MKRMLLNTWITLVFEFQILNKVNVARKNVRSKYFNWKEVIDRRNKRNEYIKYFKMVKEVDWVII